MSFEPARNAGGRVAVLQYLAVMSHRLGVNCRGWFLQPSIHQSFKSSCRASNLNHEAHGIPSVASILWLSTHSRNGRPWVSC